MSDRALVTSGTVLGMGLGGFVDGIVLHQILQVHNMLSAVRPPTDLVNLEINMFWDGLFHAATWILTAVGLALLWRTVRDGGRPLSTRVFVGSLLLGWGIFNTVEGVIDHLVLGIHHVVERAGLSVWDALFLASGVALVLGGWRLVRTGLGERRPV
jgi:uncharacterized membrane protein